jgi:hypothetical protein
MQRLLSAADVSHTLGQRQQADIQSGGRRRQKRQQWQVEPALKVQWRRRNA